MGTEVNPYGQIGGRWKDEMKVVIYSLRVLISRTQYHYDVCLRPRISRVTYLGLAGAYSIIEVTIISLEQVGFVEEIGEEGREGKGGEKKEYG